MPVKISLPAKEYKPMGTPARKYVEIPVPSTAYPMLFEALEKLFLSSKSQNLRASVVSTARTSAVRCPNL